MTCSLNRGSHPFLLQMVGTDLVGSAGHNLLGGKNAVLDQPADAVVCNPERRSGLRHREPFAILLGGTVGMNSIHPAHRADTMSSPDFSLTGGHSHPVQGRCDVLVGPSGRITARASSGVRQPCSPDLGLRTRNCECWPPHQWTVRTTLRVASSTSATMSVTRARRSRWRVRMVTPGAFHATSRSSARPVKSG